MIFTPQSIELEQGEMWFAGEFGSSIGYGQLLDLGVSLQASYLSAVEHEFTRLDRLQAQGHPLEEALEICHATGHETTYLAQKLQRIGRVLLAREGWEFYLAEDE